MKCCGTCRWYDDCESTCLSADSERCAEPVAADAVCAAWEEVGP